MIFFIYIGVIYKRHPHKNNIFYPLVRICPLLAYLSPQSDVRQALKDDVIHELVNQLQEDGFGVNQNSS